MKLVKKDVSIFDDDSLCNGYDDISFLFDNEF